MMSDIVDYFPWSEQIKEFRLYQEEILSKIVQAFDDDVKVVILEAPTGFGKSPVNVALGKYYKPSFYTTPQKKLVNQIVDQLGPSKLAIDLENVDSYDCVPLLGRNTYTCRCTGVKSNKCSIYNDGKIKDPNSTKNEFIETRCSDQECCTYWKQKKACMSADVAIITFAMLIINSYIKQNAESAKIVKFAKRNLLIIDECGNLVNQVASMFCGFKINPKAFPKDYRGEIWDKIELLIPDSDDVCDYVDFFDDLIDIVKEYSGKSDKKKDQQKFKELLKKIDYMMEEIVGEGRKWVVNVLDREKNYLEFKPVRIDRFLSETVWSQADKIILSSATIPFRNDIEKWLKILGLQDKKYKFFSVPMTFPVENRPIITTHLGGKMTSKKEEENWDLNVEMVKNVIDENIDKNGVIHCVSYKRGRKLYQELVLEGYDVFFHNKNSTEMFDKEIIDAWVRSGKKILISPAVMQGVDLKDDMCRYQIMLKVPYLNIGDKRTKYLLDIEKQWDWYYSGAVSNVVQMYGRGVRHKEDWCKFYIVDASFMDLVRKKRKSFPQYFLDAIPNMKKDVFLEEFLKNTLG